MNALCADARISYIADRMSRRWVTGFLVCVVDESLREFTSVYECLRESTSVYECVRESTSVYECFLDAVTAIHENRSMGCDEGLTGVRGRVRDQSRYVQEVCIRRYGGTQMA